ncbi:response regulator [Prolixibacteraceae bacterium JC049]|nr:response regulator [Prolixibacteraceae bacterium JC049]
MIKSFFQNMTMRTKIIVITLVISVLTTSVGLYVGYLFNKELYKKNIVENLIEDVKLISNYMVMPMEFESPEKGKEVLEKLHSKSSILNCQVFRPDNTLFTSIDFGNNVASEVSTELKTNEILDSDEYIEVYKPIIYQNQTYGAIYIRATNNFEKFQQRYFLIAALLSIVMAIVAFILAHFGQKPIVKPIKSLNQTMADITISKDYSLRLPVNGKNEIAKLNKAFNAMLDAIQLNEQERDVALDALKENEKELIKAKEKAEESNHLKTVFLQNMSHEIRTPMNAIIGFSDLLSNSTLSEEQKKQYLNIIQNNSHQLLAIVTDILTISAIETKQATVNLEKTEINAVLDELWTVFNNNKKYDNVELEIHKTLIDKEAQIFTDQTKLTQILSNLLGNALKFTPKGSIQFGYKRKVIENESVLEFFVKDTGIGIDESGQQLIFERFTQADDSIRRNFGGTGLGLSICKGFVEMLEGKIWLESELGKGTTFYFTIPYKSAISEQEETEQSKPIPSQKTVKTKLEETIVLVAEDEEYNYLFIEEVLHQKGFNLIHARDGQETIDMFKANPNIGLILMDIKMPVMSGFQAAKIIKQMQADVPIVAQSAYALESEIKRYSEVFDDYITKPISTKTLTQKVNKYLSVS